MNSIIGFSNLLINKKYGKEKTKEFLNIIQRNSNQLLNIINDIIDISKIESEQITIHKKNINLNKLLRNIYDSFNINNNKEIKFIYDYNQKTNIDIVVDDYRLNQIINNLLSNSFKFTKKGYIKFGCYIVNNLLIFYVKDTGSGIKKSDYKLIFERFTQSKHDINKGTGLGLAITKGLINMMGGDISMYSVFGKGSVFKFKIPIKKIDQSNKIDIIHGKNLPYDFTDKDILICEDDFNNFNLLRLILFDTNCNIDWSKNGKECVELYKKNKYDLILLDIRMPEYDGYYALEKIRKVDKQIPIIAQTAYALINEKIDLIKQGCTGYIDKPINSEKLLKMIDSYI
jgi:two-component system CheB/CheR fusion protein